MIETTIDALQFRRSRWVRFGKSTCESKRIVDIREKSQVRVNLGKIFASNTPHSLLESPEEWVNAKAPRGQGQIRQGGRGEDGGWRVEEDEANRARSHGFAIL